MTVNESAAPAPPYLAGRHSGICLGIWTHGGSGGAADEYPGHKSEEAQYPLRVVQIGADELDSGRSGAKNFPRQYDSFSEDQGRHHRDAPMAARCRISKLEKYPAAVQHLGGLCLQC